jgi:hypothetical protein
VTQTSAYIVILSGRAHPVTTLRAEALHYQGAAHGHHHERCLEDYGEIARFLLGLCFCPACVGRGAEHDVDVPALASAWTETRAIQGVTVHGPSRRPAGHPNRHSSPAGPGHGGRADH